jgi:hypothetical protein
LKQEHEKKKNLHNIKPLSGHTDAGINHFALKSRINNSSSTPWWEIRDPNLIASRSQLFMFIQSNDTHITRRSRVRLNKSNGPVKK